MLKTTKTSLYLVGIMQKFNIFERKKGSGNTPYFICQKIYNLFLFLDSLLTIEKQLFGKQKKKGKSFIIKFCFYIKH